MEEKLIEFMRENSFMYNRTSKNYKNVMLKENKWLELAKSLGIEVTKLKKRWKTLRDRFHRENSKARPQLPGGAIKRVTWKYFDSLVFLANAATHRSAKTNNFQQQNEGVSMVICDSFTVKEFEMPLPFGECSTYRSQPITSTPTTTKMLTEHPTTTKDRGNNTVKVEAFLNSTTDTTQTNLSQTSFVRSFFNAMAEQVEGASLPYNVWFELQMELLQSVQVAIRKSSEMHLKME